MKYPIFLLFILTSITACHQVKQEEKASYNDFFMSRSDQASSIKDQNYSTNPERQAQEEQVLEGIIPESQEEAPAEGEPKVNGASETEYLKEQQDEHDDYIRDSEAPYFEEQEREQEERFVTPEEVRSWQN